MLPKRKVKEFYEKNINEFQIRIEKNEIRFYNSYLNKAYHNLEVAGILALLSDNPENKKALGIDSKELYFDWIIITSYYAMYMAATAAVAKLGLKATTHGATISALEYRYCVDMKLLHSKYVDMIRDVGFDREDVHKLDQAMKGRIAVQYTVTAKYGQRDAKKVLEDAKEFVNKINDIISE